MNRAVKISGQENKVMVKRDVTNEVVAAEKRSPSALVMSPSLSFKGGGFLSFQI